MPSKSRIEEDDIHAEDVERRSFLRIGLFAAVATGLTGFTMGCESERESESDSADTDSGDPFDFDLTDSADSDTGDTADSD